MHISEGVLSGEILAVGAGLSVGLVILAVKNIKNEQIPKIAALSAVFFLASFIHIPIGVTSIHLLLAGFVGAFLGFGAVVAILVALFLQGLLFGYGGLSTLGVNTFIMSTPAIVGYFIFHIRTKEKLWQNVKWFMVGFVPIFIASCMLSTVLWINGEEFKAVAYLSFISNLPAMAIEGVITLFAINFIQKVAPKFLKD